LTNVLDNIFYHKMKSLVVGFFFMHWGYPMQYTIDLGKRIILSVFPLDNLNDDIPLKKVTNEFVVLANSDNQDYALSYSITIDEQKKSVFCQGKKTILKKDQALSLEPGKTRFISDV
jgi:hypothetical protein